MRAFVITCALLVAGPVTAMEVWGGLAAFAPRAPVPVAAATALPRLDGIPAYDPDHTAPEGPASPCETAVAAAEARHRLPRGLLMAIGLTEAGRGGTIWPWTVNAGGDSHYFDSRAEAVAFLRRAEAGGAANLDTGCLQVNRRWHPDAFPDAEAAFDPDRNADYAARYLVSLHREFGTWEAATGAYHSRDPDRAAGYAAKVNAAEARALALTGRAEGAEAPPVTAGGLPGLSARLDRVDIAALAARGPVQRAAAEPMPDSPRPRPRGGQQPAPAQDRRNGPTLFAAHAPAGALIPARYRPLY